MRGILLSDFLDILCIPSLGYTADWAKDPECLSRLFFCQDLQFFGGCAAAFLCHGVDWDIVFTNTSVCSGGPWNYKSDHQLFT